MRILTIFIFTLAVALPGCSSASDTASKQESGSHSAATAAVKKPKPHAERLIQLEGIHLGMKKADFKALVKVKKESNIKVRSGVKVRLYNVMDLGRAAEKKIPLKEHFSVQARNSASSPYITLNITIRNKLKQVAYQDSVSPGGWINVGN